MRRLWTHPFRNPGLVVAIGLLLAFLRVPGLHSVPLQLSPTASPGRAVQRVPDALGASLARSLAEGARGVLHLSGQVDAEAACGAAIGEGDAASRQAAGAVRGTGSVERVLAAEDGYLAAARLCLRAARETCGRAGPGIDGCGLLMRVSDADLASTRVLSVSRLR
ncbi:hypothetical protein [Paracraurococcus lichenis]|uniref:Uncharacterized protein n=1 Tax=Paracraurococcus lichenis TaxID=3064888 RepID=A0ABT9DWR9_9PROT|nr:hypothetical protein [Paracraurococcus sp. LOR1-02]MDO9708346.1 hypothetical protein [Paracraurococcus sp. LOR1-02]